MQQKQTPPDGANVSYYDFGVFIGRFQIFHNAHRDCLIAASQHVSKLLVFLGSANDAPRPDTKPFTAAERIQMISTSLPDDILAKVHFIPVEDFRNDNAWVEEVTQLTHAAIKKLGGNSNSTIALCGHAKDHTSYYLTRFPEWHTVDIKSMGDLSATPLRRKYFSSNRAEAIQWLEEEAEHVVPAGTHRFLFDYFESDAYEDQIEEVKTAEAYKASWKNAPYPPILVTVDNLIHHTGSILLIRRRSRPGKGLWALPGGYLEQYDTLYESSIREAREETRLKVPDPVMRGSLVGNFVEDDPYRSMRGRVITHCFVFDIKPKIPARDPSASVEDHQRAVREALRRPFIRGGDDAEKAKWVKIEDIKRDQMFEDHYLLIRRGLGMIDQ